jgi:ferredoxin
MEGNLRSESEYLWRAALYLYLAETLAAEGPPAWMEGPGGTWPLYEAAKALASSSPSARCAAQVLGLLPPRNGDALMDSHRRLFGKSCPPYFYLYESAWLSGHLLGGETRAVEEIYQSAGLEVEGAELPDHASNELAFLAYLAEAGSAGIEAERAFIRTHAGRWLPLLGRSLSSSGDPAYTAIGELLAGWLEEAARSPSIRNGNKGTAFPCIPVEEDCTLCGFCVQSCPRRALEIHENSTETVLRLVPSQCKGCGRCELACEFEAMRVQTFCASYPEQNTVVLRRSRRGTCESCGSALVSLAELDFVRGKLGCSDWLDTCRECRPSYP